MNTDKKTVIYRLKAGSEILKKPIGYSISIWRPSFINFCPPNKGFKYVIYWLFHWLKVFRNKSYSSCIGYDEGKIIASLLVVPAHFKWPFMGKNDVQFTYVMTSSDYRGKGLAKNLIQVMIAELSDSVDVFWYVTDTENIASIRVAEKLGFEFVGYAERRGVLNILKLKH